jgi:hypothetical protein
MDKTDLKRLGDELDEAEAVRSAMWAADKGTFAFSPDSVTFAEFERIMKRYHDAELAYGAAVTERSLAVREKYRARKTAPRSFEAFKLRDKRFAAECLIDEIVAARPEFATAREFIDANAAFIVADAIYDMAERRYQAARRRDAVDPSSIVVRHHPRRKPSEVRL